MPPQGALTWHIRFICRRLNLDMLSLAGPFSAVFIFVNIIKYFFSTYKDKTQMLCKSNEIVTVF